MQKLGWRASDTRELSFQGCAVPEGNLLGPRGDGFKQFLEILDGGRISVAAMGVGLAQGAYDLAYAYALERQQFGRPIASFQAVQFQLADLATEIEAGRALVYRAAWLKDEEPPVRAGRRAGEALHGAALQPGGERRAPDPRRLRLHGRVPDLAALPRPEDPRDRRGHERGAADGDRPAPRPAAELADGTGWRDRHRGACPCPAWDARAPRRTAAAAAAAALRDPERRTNSLSHVSILAVWARTRQGPNGLFRGPAGHYRKDSEAPLLASARDAVPAVRRRGPRLRLLPRRRRRRGRGAPDRPRLRDRAVPRPRPSRRVSASCACSRRTRTPTTCPATDGWRWSTTSRSRSIATPEPRTRTTPLADGDEVAVGAVTVRTIHTPGHRPEHCCFLVDGTLFTGDSLFVGTVARPDLAVEAREGAEGLFHSLHRLLELADDVQVFPGHVAGSLCGTGMSSAPSTTIGAERRGNPLLAIATVTDFVDETAGVGDAAAAEHGADRRAEPRPVPRRLPGARAGRGRRTTPPSSTSGAPTTSPPVTCPGALNVPVSVKGFGTRAGFVLRRDEQIVLHASSPGRGRAGRPAAARGRTARARGLPRRPAGARAARAGRARRARRAASEAARST